MEDIIKGKIDISRYTKAEIDTTEPKKNIDKIQLTYSTVYNGISVRFNLAPIEILVVATIDSLSKKFGFCYASQGTFSKIFNVSVPTIASALKELEQKRIIIKSDKKGQFGTLRWKLTEDIQEYIKEIKQQIKPKSNTKNL